MSHLLSDDFRAPRGRGRALGPASGADPRRGGRDVECIMSVDHGALRIQPPLEAGWGRTCLSYGPFPNQPGLAFSVQMLNGHNTSQSEVMSDSLRTRLQRWVLGSGTAPVGRRVWRWLRSGRVRRVLRQIRWWRRIAVGSTRVKLMDENLAVGLYPAEVCDPLTTGAGFVMHADGPRNGELWTGSDGQWSPAVLGVQNVPICYLALVRTRDILLGVSSLPGAHGLGSFPGWRPVAVVPRPAASQVHVSVHQSLLGQIGFRADSRVHGVRVAQLEEMAVDWAGAIAADIELSGQSLPGRRAAVGGAWRRTEVDWCLDLPGEAGLIRLQLEPEALTGDGVTVVWQAGLGQDRWELAILTHGLALTGVRAGRRETGLEGRWEQVPSELQILDDGREVSVVSRGRLIGRCRRLSTSAAPAPMIGIMTAKPLAPLGLIAIECHPRLMPLPGDLRSADPWQPATGAPVIADPLTGTPGDLAGRRTPVGDRTWRRLRGSGSLAVSGTDGACWQASVATPLPERTLYTVEWCDPDYVDLEVTLTPPGTARGQKEHGTAGFCLWQDADHHLLINTWLDDCYGGASLSSFPTIGGFEDLYDAIWTNVGDRVRWGHAIRLRLVCDGLHYGVWIDGEPVLQRSLTDIYPGCSPLRIKQVGLLGNWEWGADTGTRFADFQASGRATAD